MVKNISTTDPISDMLTRIKNASAVSIKTVDIPFSIMRHEIAKILEKKRFIEKAEKKKKRGGAVIELILKYDKESPAISGAKRISKPGQRIYRGYSEIRGVKGGNGIAIISTSKGLMTDSEVKNQKIGGEILCEIW